MVQYILLFKSDTWVVTPCILRVMGGIHNWSARRIYHRMPQRLWNIGWDYHPIGEALKNVGLYMIGIYVTPHQKHLAQYIFMWTILYIVVEEERRTGSPVILWWW